MFEHFFQNARDGDLNKEIHNPKMTNATNQNPLTNLQ